jgi:O-antigen/teichoic acid export membrane protein
MLFVLIVSLYTSRVVLLTLGVIDFGISNVVGGVVTMFVFLSGLISSAMGRYFMFEIGRGDSIKLNQYFSISIICFIVISFIIILFSEIIGLWFLNNKMVIPENRVNAARWVFHISIISFAITILSAPFSAMIIAFEKMEYYAVIGIIQALLKLGIVLLLITMPFDKLISYSILLLFVTIITTLAYLIFCFRNIPECRFSLFWNGKMFKELISFSAWSMIGSVASVFREQGINILLNMSFNPAINAARGIAYQVSGSLNGFIDNIYKASQPQIIKQYAAGRISEMTQLVFNVSKFSFYLILLLSTPVLFETPFLLKIWLKEIPDYTILFTRLVIILMMVESLSQTASAAIHATGNIKYLQIFAGGLMLANLPISYVFLKLGFPPQITLYVSISISIVAQIVRIVLLKIQLGISIMNYLKEVIIPIIIVTILSFILPMLFKYWSNISNSLLEFFLVAIVSVIWVAIVIYIIGLKRKERAWVLILLQSKLKLKK